MALFKQPTGQRSPIEMAVANYKTAKMDILLIVAFTAINMIMAISGSGTYFLFSASIPYYLALYASLLTGRFPPEYYEGGEVFLGNEIFYIMIALAVIFLALYVVCFFMLKKPNKVWFIVVTVAFSLDTLAMFGMLLLGGFDPSMIIDVVFHAYVLFCFIKGIKACSDIKKFEAEGVGETADDDGETVFSSGYHPSESISSDNPYANEDVFAATSTEEKNDDSNGGNE